MILTYYPDTDTLDVKFGSSTEHETRTYDTQKKAQEEARWMARESTGSEHAETETYDADPTGQTLAHYHGGRLEELTIEHASRRAPSAWDIESLRREAARVAATTGRIVESVTRDLHRDRTSFQTGTLGPQSTHTSDEAVQEFNEMIDEVAAASAAA
jgi:hypothetical protein